MKKYFKEFLHRGMLFGGFGPIIAGIVFLILSVTLEDFSLTGPQAFIAILSTYILAFLQSGASVFNQIEHWSPARSLLWHFLTIYIAYAVCYLVNSWIPFDLTAVLMFTVIFIVCYFIVWISVFLSVKAAEKRLNTKLK